MVQCVLGVFYTALKLQENIFFWTCELGPNGKISIFPCETWIVVVSNLPEKHTDSFFSSLQQQHWSSIWVFWKKQAACVYFLGSHLTVQFHLFRVTTITAVKMHRIRSHELFSHGILQCILGVSLHNSHMQAKLVFSLCNSLIVPASNWTEKHPGSYFSS